MSHFVPDFETDDDFSIPASSSSLNLPKKSAMAEDEIMELLWQNGQVVVQNQRSQKKSSPPAKPDCGPSTATDAQCSSPPHQQPSDHHLFMQEDEMASWLHYPLHDDDFCSDLLYPNPAVSNAPPSVSHAQPSDPHATPTDCRAETGVCHAPSMTPVPLDRRTGNEPKTVRNFGHFSRLKASNSTVESGPSVSKVVVRESTVVDSSVTPAAVAGASTSAAPGFRSKDVAAPCDVSMTSSSGELAYKQPVSPSDDRKRKGREADEVECQSEDVKKARGSTCSKRSRAAEVHNLSERRRRDRINEKMKALQELIPRCNKSDKASMLDEAIEYLKSLQLQVQMMSMGCGMVPMMYPGVQQYMPHVPMGMSMEMGMNRPIMPFPNRLPGPAFPNLAHLGGPRFPIPAFPVPPPMHAPEPSRIQGTNQPEMMVNPFQMRHLNHPNISGFPDPYQHFLGLPQMQMPPTMQNPSTDQPSSSKPSTGKEPENLGNGQSG